MAEVCQSLLSEVSRGKREGGEEERVGWRTGGREGGGTRERAGVGRAFFRNETRGRLAKADANCYILASISDLCLFPRSPFPVLCIAPPDLQQVVRLELSLFSWNDDMFLSTPSL